MQKLSVSKRAAQVGGSIVNRTQMHGKKEKVPAISVPVGGIILTEDEFCAIMQDPHAYEAFFTGERSAVMEPRFPGMDPITISDKFEGAKATLKIEDAEDSFVLKPATIGSIVITPMGAQPIMKCMVSGVPDIHLQTLTLLNKRCTISILNGALAERDEKQKDLPLDGGGPNVHAADAGEDDAAGDGDALDATTLAAAQAEEDAATESAIGRQIHAHETRKRRAAGKKK